MYIVIHTTTCRQMCNNTMHASRSFQSTNSYKGINLKYKIYLWYWAVTIITNMISLSLGHLSILIHTQKGAKIIQYPLLIVLDCARLSIMQIISCTCTHSLMDGCAATESQLTVMVSKSPIQRKMTIITIS